MNKDLVRVRVAEIVDEALDIRRFPLRPERGVLPAFTPGAHIDVHISDKIVRQYSICNGPEDRDHYVIAVQRESRGRGGSLAIYERIKRGDVMRIGAPRNNFPLDDDPAYRLLLAGGIGITPLL